MKKRNMAILGMFMMMASLGISKNHVFAATNSVSNTSGIEVQAYNDPTTSSWANIKANIKVINNSGADIDLSTLKLRYYFTEEGTQAESFWCDYSGLENGATGYHNVQTSSVTGNFVKLDASQSTDKANQYVEISFAQGSGTLEKGADLLVQMRFAKSDWSNYDQSNDYSFNSSATGYVDENNITGYINGQKAWGQEPISVPSINPTSGVYDPAAPAEVSTVESLNGGKLVGITNNGQSFGYTEDAATGKVTLSQADLSKLAPGAYTLTFNYTDSKGNAVPLSFTLTVKDTSNPVISPVNLTFDKQNPEDENVTVTPNGNTFKDIKDENGNILNQGTDYTLSGNDITFSKTYLSTLSNGTHTFTIEYVSPSGTIKSVTLTIKVEERISLNIGNVSGNPGDTVVVPVTIKTGNRKDMAGVTANIIYDPTKFTVTPDDVTPGDIVPDAANNFQVGVENGVIEITFMDGSVGNKEPLTADGILAYIKFLIRNDALPGKSDLKFADDSAVVSEEQEAVDSDFNSGSITVSPGPTIAPSTINYDPSAPKDTTVTITLNGYKFKDVIDDQTKGVLDPSNYTLASDGSSIVLNNSYLSTLKQGTYTYTIEFAASDGKIKTDTLTVVVRQDSPIKIKIGDVTGKPGDKVKVPVTITTTRNDVAGITLNIKYDASKFTVTPDDVTPGDIIPDAANNFQVGVENGFIEITFMDGSVGNKEPLTLSGILAYIDFTINKDAAAGKNDLTASDDSAAVAEDQNTIKTEFDAGSITIPGDVDPVITPTEVDFDKTAPKDTTVTMTLNGYKFKDVIDNQTKGVLDPLNYTLASDGSSIVLNKSYLSTLTKGTYTYAIEFAASDGTIKTDTLTVVVSEDSGIDIKIGDVKGKPGDKVKVPVTITTTRKDVAGITLNIKYDASKFTVTPADVTPGDVIPDAANNFQVGVENGFIEITFMDGSVGNKEPLTLSGILAYIDFTINKDAATGKNDLTASDDSAAVAEDQNAIKTTFDAGSVTVIPGDVDPVITPTEVDFDKTAPKDTTVTMTLNKYKFKDVIDNQTKGVLDPSNYTLSSDGSSIVLNSSYLSTLKVGTYTYAIEFVGSDGTIKTDTLTVVISGESPIIKDSTLQQTSGTFALNAPKDLTVGINLNGNTLKGIDVLDGDGKTVCTLQEGTDYTESTDGTVTILSSGAIKNLAVGQYTLRFNFSAGKSADYSLTVVNSQEASMSLGTASGKAGDTVTIPVKMTILKDKTVGTVTAHILYDSSKFDLVDAKAGEIVTDPDKSYFYKESTPGVICLSFVDDTLGTNPMVDSGNFAYIQLKVKDGAAAGDSDVTIQSNLKVTDDSDDLNIIKYEIGNGSVTIE